MLEELHIIRPLCMHQVPSNVCVPEREGGREGEREGDVRGATYHTSSVYAPGTVQCLCSREGGRERGREMLEELHIIRPLCMYQVLYFNARPINVKFHVFMKVNLE